MDVYVPWVDPEENKKTINKESSKILLKVIKNTMLAVAHRELTDEEYKDISKNPLPVYIKGILKNSTWRL